MQKTVERIHQAIRRKETIGIWGDFDVDGQTSTTILYSGLRQLGANVQYHIPIRASESHGISLPALQTFLSGGVGLLLTCDTGITAVEPIRFARDQGVDTLITDHHELPGTLPEAYAILNPHLLPENHPAASLSGAGVAYELIDAMMRQDSSDSGAKQFLDLVALGLVADLADMRLDTRFFTHKGIQALRSTSRLGIQTLLRHADLDPASLSEEHISYGLAPRLNAVGRLDDANSMVRFFTSEDELDITAQVNKMEALNERRKLLSSQVFEAAIRQAQQVASFEQDPILVLAHSDWPASVLGVAASHVVEATGKPTILLNLAQDGTARGSARSVEGVHIKELFDEVCHLLISYGGHAMAAGLSLPAEKIVDLRNTLSRRMQSLPHIQDSRELVISSFLDLSSVSLEDALFLEKLSPFGPGNPAPVFAARDVVFQEKVLIGKAKEHAVLIFRDNRGNQFKILRWQGAGTSVPDGLIDLAFLMRQSNYRGNLDLQFVYVDARPVAPEPVIDLRETPLNIIDVRQQTNIENFLLTVPDPGNTLVWEEGLQREYPHSRNRNQVIRCKHLVIWTIPPSDAVVQQVRKACEPETVYVGGRSPLPGTSEQLLSAILSIVKYSLAHDDFQDFFARSAAKLATTETAVICGLRLLAALGKIPIRNQFVFTEKGLLPDNIKDLNSARVDFEAAMDEVTSYRNFFARVSAPGIFNQVEN